MGALALLAALASDGYSSVGQERGVRIESRPVEGSAFVELRLTTVAPGEVPAMCARAYGTGRFDPSEPHLTSRQLLWESKDERVTYEVISPPLVSSRDYAVRKRRTALRDGGCRVDFEAANELAPPSPPGSVRIEKLRGSFLFVPLGAGQVEVTHTIHLDPGGQLAAFMVEPSRRAMALAWLARVAGPARPPRPDPPGR